MKSNALVHSRTFLLLLLSIFSWNLSAQTTFVVSNTNDSGAGSLRQAILDANANSGADIIDMSGASGTVLLGSGLPKITESLTINGPGEESLSISGQDLYRPFFIDNGTVLLNNFSIIDGYAKGEDGESIFSSLGSGPGAGGGAGMGGGLIANVGVDLTLENMTFDGNQAIGGDGAAGSLSLGPRPGAAGGAGPFIGSPNAPSGNGAFGSGGSSGEIILVPSLGGSTHGGNGGYGAGGGGAGSAAYRDNNGDPIPLYSAGLGGKHGGDGGINCTTLQDQAGNCDVLKTGAYSGGGGAGLGGAIFSRAANTVIRNSTFLNNTATGGLANHSGTDFGAGMHNSDGQGKGGAFLIYSEAGNVPTYMVEGNIYVGNTAEDAGTIDTDNPNIFLETGLTFVDNTVFGIKRSIPANGATTYADGTDIEIWFNQLPFADGIQTTLDNSNIASKIAFREKILTTAVTFTATVDINKVTITPTQALTPGVEYEVVFSSIFDEEGNAPSLTPITFSTDISEPSFVSNPSNGQLLAERTFTLTANEPILKTDGSAISNGDLSSLLSITENDDMGASIPYTATIFDRTITISVDNPVADQVLHIAINNVEDIAGNELLVAETFTLTSPSGISIKPDPSDGGTIGKRLYAINANEPLYNTDNSILTDDDLASKILLRETNMAGADVAFDAFLEGNTIYIASNALANNITYWVSIQDVEDVTGIEIAQETFTFSTSNLFNPVSGAGFAVNFTDGEISTDDIALAGDFTIEAWINTSYSGGLIAGNEMTAGLIEFGITAGQLSLGDGTTTVSSVATVNDGMWHHVAASLSGTSAQLYIDGVADGSGTIVPNTRTINRLAKGHQGGSTAAFSGTLDEVRIWNTAVSGTDILSNLSAGLNGTHPDIANLAAYFSLDESVGSFTHDYNGNLTRGTLSGDFTWGISGVNFPAPGLEITVDAVPVPFEGTYDFGSLGLNATSTAKTFQIENTGTVDLLLRGNPVVELRGPSAGEFTLDETGISTTLSPTGTTSFTVSFTPTIAGFREAEIVIENGSINDPYIIKLQGQGLDITTSGNWDFVGGSPGVLSLMSSGSAHNGEFYAAYNKLGTGRQLAKLVDGEFQDVGTFDSFGANMEISPGGRIFTFSTDDVNTATSVRETNTTASSASFFTNSNFSINTSSAFDDRTRFAIAFDGTKSYAAYSYADDGNVLSMHGIKIDELVSGGSTSSLATLTRADLVNSGNTNWNIFAYDIAFDASDNLWVAARTRISTQAELFLAKYDGSWTVYDLSATPGLEAATHYVGIAFDSNDDIHIANMGGGNTVHYIKASTAGTVLTSDVVNTFTTYSSQIQETGGSSPVPMTSFALGTDGKPIFVYVDADTDRPKALKYDNAMFNEFNEGFIVVDQVNAGASEPFSLSVDPVSGRAYLAYTTASVTSITGSLQSVVSTNPIMPEITVSVDNEAIESGAQLLLQSGVGFEKQVTLKLANTGVTDLELTGDPIIQFTGTNIGGLSYDLTDLSASLAASEFIEIPISFIPQSPFDEVVTLTIPDNTPTGATTVSIQLSGLDPSNSNGAWEQYSFVGGTVLNSMDMTIINGQPVWAVNDYNQLNGFTNPNTGMLENFEVMELHTYDADAVTNGTPNAIAQGFYPDPTNATDWTQQGFATDYFQKIRLVTNPTTSSATVLASRPFQGDEAGTPFDNWDPQMWLENGSGFNFIALNGFRGGFMDGEVDDEGDIFYSFVSFLPSTGYDIIVRKGTQALGNTIFQLLNVGNADTDIDMELDDDDIYLTYGVDNTLQVVTQLKTASNLTTATNILNQSDVLILPSSDARTKDLEFSSAGDLWLAYIENSTGDVRVKSYDGTGSSWTDLPAIDYETIIVNGRAVDVQLQIHPDGTPYVSAVVDGQTGQTGIAAIHRFRNGSWELVGNTVGFSYQGFDFNADFITANYNIQKAIFQLTDQGKPYLLAGNKVYTINILPDDFDQVPEFTSTSPVSSIDEGVAYTYNIVTDDADAGDALTITATDVPAWLIFTDNGDRTATLSGTPSDEDIDNYTITLTVSDGIISVDQVVNLEVTNIDNDPDFFIEDVIYYMDESQLARSIDISGITDGDASLDQTLTFTVTSDNTALISDQVVNHIAGSETATLDFTHAPDMHGDANLTVRLEDDGLQFKEMVVRVNVVEGNVFLISSHPSGTQVIEEDVAIGTEVGIVIASDVDFDETYTFSLVSGTGDTQNSLFTLVGNSLQTAATLDFETVQTPSIRIQGDNGAGAIYERVYVLSLLDVNEAATDFTLSSTDFDEGVPIGTVVGTFSATDPDATNNHIYTLNGLFGNNDAFQIVGNELQIAQVTDFDSFSGPYSIQVQLDDSGITLLRDFNITLNNINVSPTGITLTNETISEEFGVGSIVGNLIVSDTDGDDTHTFTFADDAISNTDFEIDGIMLKTTRTFDFEAETSVDVEIKVTDAASNTYNEVFTLTITDANDGPTAIDLTSTSVDENVAVGTVVGTLSTTDQDAGDTHTYEIASTFNFEIDGVVRSPLAISGNELVTDIELDHEGFPSFMVRIISTDAAGAQTLADYTIDVNNVNETPTDLALSNDNIDEDAAVGSVIGMLSTTDPDAGETHTYEVLTSFEDGGVTFFPIIADGANLITTVPLDFESVPFFNIEVQVTDAGGLTYTELFTLAANDVNEAPTGMTLSENTIAENTGAGIRVGLLIPEDQDANQVFTFSLVAGTGDEGNAFFQIGGAGGNEIENAAILDFETQSSYSVRARVTDQAGLFFEEVFTIEVTDNNDGPTGATLSSATIPEHSVVGTNVGAFTAIDQDANDTHTFTLHPNYPDNSFFAIDGANLNVAGDINFESTPTLTVGIIINDASGGNSAEAEFIIAVTDVDEGQDQTITFEPLAERTFGDEPFELTATTDSGLPIIYTSSDPGVATITGSLVTIVSAGETTITASQPGNAAFNPATAVSQTLVVAKATQTITFAAISDQEIGVAPITLSATTSSGLALSFNVTGPATIAGNLLTITDVGEIVVTASQEGDNNYLAAESVTRSFLVSDPAKTDQTITFEALTNQTFGNAAFDLTATASSELPVTYSSSNVNVVTIAGSTVTIVGAGETVITASQGGNDSFNPAESVAQTLVVEKADQFLTFEIPDKVTTDDPFEVTATSDSGLPVTISIVSGPATIDGNTITLTGEAGIVEVSFSQAGNDNYNSATVVAGFTVSDVSKQDQVITFDLPSVAYISDASVALSASSDSGLDIEFKIIEGGAFATINNGVLELIAPGFVTIAAAQFGNDDFNPAVAVSGIEIKPVFTLSGTITAQGSTFNGGTVVAIGGVTDETYTVEVSGEGDYVLENLKDGEYYLGIDPTNTDDYYSTYYGNEIFWEDAVLVTVTNADLPGFGIEVQAKPGDDLLDGNGVITGRVIEDDGSGGRVEVGRILDGTAIPDVSVFLIRLSDDQIMTEVISDENGDFEITGIPEGEYRLQVEVTGVSMDLGGSSISIDAEGTPVVLTAMVGEDGISLNVEPVLGVDESLQIQVYPNPATNFIHTQIEGTSRFRVLDLKGQTLLRGQFENNIRLDVRSLDAGIYFLEVTQGNEQVIEKFVKVN